MTEQSVAQHLSLTPLKEVKRSGKLQPDTPVVCLCSSGRPDFGNHIKSFRKDSRRCVR